MKNLFFCTLLFTILSCNNNKNKSENVLGLSNNSQSMLTSNNGVETYYCRSIINDSQVVQFRILRDFSTGLVTISRTIEVKDISDSSYVFIDDLQFGSLISQSSSHVIVNIDSSTNAWYIPMIDPQDPITKVPPQKVYTPRDFSCECCEVKYPDAAAGAFTKMYSSHNPMATLKCSLDGDNCRSCGLNLCGVPAGPAVLLVANDVIYD